MDSGPQYIYILQSFVFSPKNYMLSSLNHVTLLASHIHSTLMVYKTKLMVGVLSLIDI